MSTTSAAWTSSFCDARASIRARMFSVGDTRDGMSVACGVSFDKRFRVNRAFFTKSFSGAHVEDVLVYDNGPVLPFCRVYD